MGRLFRNAIVAAAVAVSLGGCVQTGTGKKIGMIVKVSKVGLFCPTWEAEIVRGGFATGSGVNGKSFDFTIESDADAQALTEVMEAQKEVEITYRREAMTFCRSESDDNFLTSFKPR